MAVTLSKGITYIKKSVVVVSELILLSYFWFWTTIVQFLSQLTACLPPPEKLEKVTPGLNGTNNSSRVHLYEVYGLNKVLSHILFQ